jgi:type I site-specific restriction endonuclease
MRDCQFEANTALEQSFVRDALRSLVQMATGAGKTYLNVNPLLPLHTRKRPAIDPRR